MRHALLPILVLVLSLAPNLEAAQPDEGDWPRFRGPTGHGVSNDAKIPTEWSDSKNLKWKAVAER